MKRQKVFTRKDLAVSLSSRLDIPVDRAKAVVDHTLDVLALTLVSGTDIEFRGFGMLDVVTRKQTVGRNPRNVAAGDYLIPARRVVRFRTSGYLFGKLNPEA